MMTIELIDPPSEIYNIADENEDVILKIEYGNVQPSQVSRVKFSSSTSLSILIKKIKDEISEEEFNLGKGKDIKNQILSIKTFLGDSSPITNRVSATYTFINGSSTKVFPTYSYTVAEDFESIVVRLIFFLKK